MGVPFFSLEMWARDAFKENTGQKYRGVSDSIGLVVHCVGLGMAIPVVCRSVSLPVPCLKF